MGFEIDPRYWGRGYGSEALSALLSYGDRQLRIARFRAISGPSNARAHHVLEELHFVREGPRDGGVSFVLEVAAA